MDPESSNAMETERGEEPFATIMDTVATLDGRALLLTAPSSQRPSNVCSERRASATRPKR